MTKEKKKNFVIAAALCLLLATGSVMAYFTAGDSATNTFTIGKIAIDLTEDHWTPPTDITPNQCINKDPQIDNIGDNPTFAFVRVTVPKATIITDSSLDGTQNTAAAVTELFQLNKSASDAGTTEDAAVQWSGRAVNNAASVDLDHWALVASATSAAQAGSVGVDESVLTDNNVYVFAYGTSSACTSLATGASTQPLFQSVTFCNAVEKQGLENSTLNVEVEAFGIQTNDLTQNNVTAPSAVWNVLNSQNPVEA